MGYFDSLVLPQSLEHIVLLQYIQMLIFFIFLPFSGIIISGTLISLIYKYKALKSNNSDYTLISKEVLETVTINKSAGIALGLIPAFATLIIYSQLLHESGSYIINFLFLAFILYSIGLVLIYVYRYAFLFSDILSSTHSVENTDEDELKKIAEGSLKLKNKSGVYGLILISLSMLLFFGCITLGIYPRQWTKIHNIFTLIFSWEVLLRYLSFIISSLAVTGGLLLFILLYWEGGKKNLTGNQKEILRSFSTKLIFIFSIIQPILLFLGLTTLPDGSISTSIFSYSIIAVIILLIVYILTYVMVKESLFKYSGYIFILLVFVFVLAIVKDQLAMNNSTVTHSLVLNSKYQEYIKTLQTGGDETAGANGEEVYKRICSTCHRFDQKLVGPPYKETLPKYEGKIDELIAFVKNPVKKNSNYPPMPNPGLKPNEAKAVAIFIMGAYKK
jgi:cytochrome c